MERKIPTQANIHIDRNKDEIRIDSAKPQRYSLVSFLDSGYNKDNNKYVRWQAMDRGQKTLYGNANIADQ